MSESRCKPLHLASAAGNLECCEALIAAGAHVNSTDEHGKTPLDYASQTKSNSNVRELLERSGALTPEQRQFYI